MASAVVKTLCVVCKKTGKSKCSGCESDYCLNHFSEHHQEFIKEFNQLEKQYNVHRQTIVDQRKYPQQHSLIQQIDQWEKESIEKIQQKANESRRTILKYLSQSTNKPEEKLKQLTEELERVRHEDNFNEIELNQLKNTLKQLENELKKPLSISIEQKHSSAFIQSISVKIEQGKNKFIIISIYLPFTF